MTDLDKWIEERAERLRLFEIGAICESHDPIVNALREAYERGAREEREACAKVAAGYKPPYRSEDLTPQAAHVFDATCLEIAAMIRSHGAG